MAAFRRGIFFLPQFQQVRCRSKVNIQHPKPRHDARRLFEAVTRPIILPEPISHMEVCARRKAKVLESLYEENPYEEFLLKRCKKMLAENRMLAVCLMLPMTAEQRKAARNLMVKKGLTLRFFSNSLMRRAVDDTALVNLIPYLKGRNMYVVSKEPCINELVTVLRKVPELILLGGRVDNYLLNKEAMMRAAKLPSLDILRGELATILGSSASRTHSLLGNHQQMLAMNLDQYIKQSQEGESSSSSSSVAASSVSEDS